METMTPRPMRENDEKGVRRLYELAYPHWPVRAERWYFAHPTLVIEDGGDVLGFTSFSLGSMTGLLMLHGQDIVVDLTRRGEGLGHQLHHARLELGRDLGATMFSGFTQDDNVPMQRIFLLAGHHRCQVVRRYFPDGQDGVLYLGPLMD